jgi:hypothetical protein
MDTLRSHTTAFKPSDGLRTLLEEPTHKLSEKRTELEERRWASFPDVIAETAS